MRKQGGKRFLAVMLVIAAAMTQVLSVDASTMSKAKDAKKAAESDLNKANSQIETIEKQQQALQTHWEPDSQVIAHQFPVKPERRSVRAEPWIFFQHIDQTQDC